MDLKTYLVQNRYTVTAFCKLLGCSRIHLYGILKGRRRCMPMLGKLISKVTNGEVTEEEMVSICKSVKDVVEN